MVKTKIIETTETYDEEGRLTEKITREETTEDDTKYYPDYTTPVIKPCRDNTGSGRAWEPYCSGSSGGGWWISD